LDWHIWSYPMICFPFARIRGPVGHDQVVLILCVRWHRALASNPAQRTLSLPQTAPFLDLDFDVNRTQALPPPPPPQVRITAETRPPISRTGSLCRSGIAPFSPVSPLHSSSHDTILDSCSPFLVFPILTSSLRNSLLTSLSPGPRCPRARCALSRDYLALFSSPSGRRPLRPPFLAARVRVFDPLSALTLTG
jgi:hypothetical protein